MKEHTVSATVKLSVKRETPRCEAGGNFKEQTSKQPLKAVIQKN
jgi:hypothetical protein